MDTQNPVVDVPNLKLAKVGANREKKRGGAGWLGGRGAGSAFSGAAGGAGAGGGIFGTGMSLAKLLTILLVSGGLSAGAWEVGNMMSASSAGSPAAPKVFADKDGSQKYGDTSGVIKGGDKSIPNSLGYINNDGLTDEQRAAKKAADEAAAAKAAADAQAKADAEAKEKALADAKAASATPEPAAAAPGSPASPKLALGSGKFGGMKSSFGGGGGGLSGGAGLSGGINRSFGGAGAAGGKAQNGALAAFRSPTKAASTRAAGPSRGKSNSKGFAKQQLDMANGLSRTAAGAGKSETAATGAATPFDNNGAQGSVISGPGLGNGTQTGPADSGGSNNPSSGLGGPITSGAACQDANFEPDINGNCVNQTPTPHGQDADPNQWIYTAVEVLLGITALMAVVAMMLRNSTNPYAMAIYAAMGTIFTILGGLIMAMGILLIAKSGDILRGGIITAVGTFVGAAGLFPDTLISATGVPHLAAPILIASALGMLTAGTSPASMKSGAMQ